MSSACCHASPRSRARDPVRCRTRFIVVAWRVVGQRVAPLGVERFGQTGSLAELYAAYRLDGAAITQGIAELLLMPS